MFVQRETTSASATLENPSNGLIFFGLVIRPLFLKLFSNLGPFLRPYCLNCRRMETGPSKLRSGGATKVVSLKKPTGWGGKKVFVVRLKLDAADLSHELNFETTMAHIYLMKCVSKLRCLRATAIQQARWQKRNSRSQRLGNKSAVMRSPAAFPLSPDRVRAEELPPRRGWPPSHNSTTTTM